MIINKNKIIMLISVIVLFSCSFLGAFLNKKSAEKYENINWTSDISLNTDISNIKLMPLLSGDNYIPTENELNETVWDKNKINIDVQYHDDPTDIANRYGLPFGTSIVYDKSGNQILLKSSATMATPVYYKPENQIYNPITFIPNYKESVLLRTENIKK